jgi:hypothetical protein
MLNFAGIGRDMAHGKQLGVIFYKLSFKIIFIQVAGYDSSSSHYLYAKSLLQRKKKYII